MTEQPVDIAIIGAGTAGMAAYQEARKFTDSIALIEGRPFGTTCARVGCMPSKLLIAPAEARHRLQSLPAFGISADAGSVDGQAIMRRVREERDWFVGFVEEAVNGFNPGHIIRATARFEDDHILTLDDGRKLRADRVVIATGSRANIPPPFQAAGDRLIVNDDVFDWDDLPGSVAVFGAGVIGLELGQALHRLGVRVRLFGQENLVGPLSDPEVLSYAAATISAELPTALDAKDTEITRDGDDVVVYFTDETGERREERFDYLLAATGRRANVDTLSLDKTSLELNARGAPVYDSMSMQAGSKPVFIAGDATVDLPLLHEAADEGRLAGENAGRYPEIFKRARRTPLGIVFTDPQIAVVGQGYGALTETRSDFAIGDVSFEDQGRARVMLANKGLLRVYGDKTTGLLLGAEMIAPAAEHLAHLLAWSIQSRLTVADVLERPFYHPVLEEGLRTALRSLHHALGMGSQPPLRCIDCGPGG